MYHLTTSTNRRPAVLSKRISAVGFGAVAAAALLFCADSAEAAAPKISKELAALQAELAKIGKKTTSADKSELANAQQLADAIKAIIAATPATRTFNYGKLVGEALKTEAGVSNTAGDEIGAGVIQALGTPSDAVLISLIGTAATTAASGKGAIPFEISSFVAGAIGSASTNAQSNVLSAAQLASKSKTAVAEIVSGYASIADPTTVANAALGIPKLAGAVTEIAREVGALVPDADIDTFVSNIAKTSTVTKVAAGAVAAKPNEAGAITDTVLGNSGLNPSVVKGMAGYAKAVASVADIEQISVIGGLLARQIGASATGAKIGVAAGLAKTLAAAILARPSDATAATSADNRVDEIAEVAAYVVGGAITNSGVNSRNVNATILNIIKGAIAGTKTKNRALLPTAVAVADPALNLLADIAGSVANTLNGTVYDSQALITFLTSSKTLKAIAGKNATLQQSVKDAILLGFNDNRTEAESLRLEDGKADNSPGLNGLLTALVDPETDKRNF